MATILVVDDRPENRALLGVILGSRGHRVLEAGDGVEALEIVSRERPDLVITDLVMPTIDGFELLRRLRAHPSASRTPVILYSATYQRPEAQRLAEIGGAVSFLVKPAEAQTILDEVDKALEKSASPAPHAALPSEEYAREHVQALTNKVAQTVDELEAANLKLVAHAAKLEQNVGELQEALQRAEQSDKLKTAFLANMSHEVRTPLNIILGYNQLIADQLHDAHDDSIAASVDAIRSASDRLIHTIQGILDISRLETGTFPVRPESLNLGSLVQDRLRELRARADRKGLSLTCEIDVPDVEVWADEYCMRNSLDHLLDNAIKFTERGGVAVRLSRDAEGRLCVSIRDTGVGIDPAYVPRLFEPFSQEEFGYTRAFEGSGIGLALVKRYLERNDAEISLQSEKGRGTTFTIRFSPSTERAGDRVAAAAASSGLPPRTGTRPDRPAVLVVEDDAASQRYVVSILRRSFEVLTAATGAEARVRLAEHPDEVAVVLMDLSLKGDEDGIMLTRWLRSDAHWRNVPIIATTAHALSEDQQTALAAGCSAYLAKPFSPQQLMTAVRQAFGRAPGPEGAAQQ